MKLQLIFVFIFTIISNFSYSQCADCPSGSTLISGSTNINEQNNATDFCIDGDWSGQLQNIADGSTLTICPGVTWTMQGDIIIQKAVDIFNYGSITDDGNDYLFKIQGGVDFVNEISGTITIESFENQDAEFDNLGSLTADDIYLHGPSSNSGTITSTATDCNGSPNTSCGFFIGDKGTPFVNDGTVNTVDANLSDQIIGGSGIFTSTGTLAISNNGGSTDNFFYVNNLNLQSGQTVSLGTFEVSGDLNCNNATVTTDVCFAGTGGFSSTCSGSSDDIESCTALAVNIVAFSVQKHDRKLIFNWETNDEINVSHYEIHESSDGKYFAIKSEVGATQNRYYQDVINYSTDTDRYFRLKSVDLDGTEEFHGDIKFVAKTDKVAYTIMPNPVDRDQRLNIAFDEKQNVLVSIYNLRGEKILTMNYEDRNNVDVDLREIKSSGIYLIKIFAQNETYTEEIFFR